MRIHVLGINGSPRNGNSRYLLDHALEGAKEVGPDSVIIESYNLRGKTFKPCIACSYCAKHEGECIQKNDDFEELRKKWYNADVIFYSVPVYHMSMPGQLKCFIDRLGNSMFGLFQSQYQDLHGALPKLYKVIGSIAQGIHIFSGQEHTITDLINHALIMQCIPVSGDLWQAYIGVGGWTSNLPERNGLKKVAQEGDLSARSSVCRELLHAKIYCRVMKCTFQFYPLLKRNSKPFV